MLECRELGVPYFYDPSQQIVRMELDDLREGISTAHMLIVNDYEFSLIKDKLDLTQEKIVAQGTILGITRGEAGIRHIRGWAALPDSNCQLQQK